MMNWLTRDWGLKLISLVLAVGLWYYAVGEEGIEVTRVVPLDIHVKSKEMSILKTSEETVQVTFIAPRAQVSELAAQTIRAVHEIAEDVKTAGDYSFRIEPREIKFQIPQVRILRIEPEVIQVTLDELIVQKLEVQPDFVGEPAFGYKMVEKQIQINPNAVLVEGPKGQLEKLPAVKTEKVDLVGRIRSFRRTVPVKTPPNVRVLSEPLIDVYIPIQEEYDEKKFEKIPVKILASPEGKEKVSVSPVEVSFSLQGARKQLEKLAPEKILAYADLSGLEPGPHEVPVQLLLPEEVSLKAGQTLTVKAEIKK